MIPAINELPESLQKVLNPSNAKMLAAVASGAAPLPPKLLIEAWVCLMKGQDQALATAASKSLSQYPEKMLVGVLQGELESWALEVVSEVYFKNESILEAVLLNHGTPDRVFVSAAKVCSERLANLIANNQERIIQAPEIIPALESNPNNLRSTTDRLRHFLQLAGVFIPGDKPPAEEEKPLDLTKLDSDPSAEKTPEQADAAVDALLKSASRLNEEQRLNLTKYISQLNVGGKIKLAMKGNKEARQILVRDVNSIVAVSVIKSPRITENEVAAYARLRSVCDDVIRQIAVSPQYSKNYDVKLALVLHPKTPLQSAMAFLKFLSYRDLQKAAKDRNILMPVKKAAKELVELKRR